MRLIDADALKKRAYLFPCAIGSELAVTIRAINEMPTIDAVPVVRCRECQHWSIPDDSYGWCSEWENTVENPDCYCACGKRREDGDT